MIELPTDIAKKVLSDLHEIIKDIQSNQPNFKGTRYAFGLKCDLCREETDYPCPRHEKKACSNGDCVHFLSLHDLKKPLIFCPKNLAGTNTSKLHTTSWVKATGKMLFFIHFLMSVTVNASRNLAVNMVMRGKNMTIIIML